jgi:hypothetical protein
LGYTYTQYGTTFIIDKQPNIISLKIDVCLSITQKTGSTFVCPSGYVNNENNDGCQKIVSTGVTFSGLGQTIASGNTSLTYGFYGAYFYESIQNNASLPVYYIGDFSNLINQSGGTITPLNTIITGNTFWSNNSGGGNGRLNKIGLSASTTEWLGISKCVDIPYSGTYYVGLAADNDCRVKLNSQLIINFSGSSGDNFKKWSVFPFELKSGKNIIEMEGLNASGPTSFGVEIYYPTNYSTLTAATSTSEAGVILSSVNYIGDYWDLGTTLGYQCPSGYSLDTCSTAYTCTKILRTGYTDTCSGSCAQSCSTICNDDFPYIDNVSQGVYIFNSTNTTIPLTFNFTGNTSSLTGNNSTFKYEIYKYLPSSGVFKLPAVYKSDTIEYSSFSGTNLIAQSVSLSGLSLDGDYLIKGYFEVDACTDFMKRLGKKINTLNYKNGDEYGLYIPETDFYFVAISEAEVPLFNNVFNDLGTYSPISLYQQVILVDFSNEGNIPENPNDFTESNLYERTGSTFVLTNEYVGDVIVTLNGLTMAKDIDYSLSGQVLTFYGTISNQDIITLFYTRTLSSTLISDVILVNSGIPSGTTNTQGTNKYFYNTTTSKYEIYTNNTPVVNTKIMIMLNGVTLADGIDYYQSTTNLNRIILVGNLWYNDIINIIYYPMANVINGITQANNYIAWYVQNGPQLNNGEFALEYSTTENFVTYTTANIVEYSANVTNYSSILSLSGDVGTEYYYRVKNTKNYASICGDLIESTVYSEIVPVIVQNNAINSY